MLLFNAILLIARIPLAGVSIHPMLLFNDSITFGKIENLKFQYIPCYCSTYAYANANLWEKGFQYIPCYCSTDFDLVKPQISDSFQYIPCYCSTSHSRTRLECFCTVSIHPMLLFNNEKVCITLWTNNVSIHPMLLFNVANPTNCKPIV